MRLGNGRRNGFFWRSWPSATRFDPEFTDSAARSAAPESPVDQGLPAGRGPEG
jgi:hypothetical protein